MNNGYSVFQVGRAFSFNKTPSKLKRAMSTVMSPMAAGSVKTPSEPFSQMRLEVGVSPDTLISISFSLSVSLLLRSPSKAKCLLAAV